MHDEILKLKQLLDQGVLTEEEFTAAKRKLLDMDAATRRPKEVSQHNPTTKPVPPPNKSGFAPSPYKETAKPICESSTKTNKECPNCSAIISQSAIVCPACGCSLTRHERANNQKVSSSFQQKRSKLLFLVVCLLVSVCALFIVIKNAAKLKVTPEMNLPFQCSIDCKLGSYISIGSSISTDVTIKNTSDYVIFVQIKDENGGWFANTDIPVSLAPGATLLKSGTHQITTENINDSQIRMTVSYSTQEKPSPSFHDAIYSWDKNAVLVATTAPMYTDGNYSSTPQVTSSTYNNEKSSSSFSSTVISKDLKYDLIDITEYYVKKHLKSPSSAKFPLYSQWSVSQGEGNVYMVFGYVDSQNSFGATLRETVGAMIRYNGEYSLVMVQIGDNTYFD